MINIVHIIGDVIGTLILIGIIRLCGYRITFEKVK